MAHHADEVNRELRQTVAVVIFVVREEILADLGVASISPDKDATFSRGAVFEVGPNSVASFDFFDSSEGFPLPDVEPAGENIAELLAAKEKSALSWGDLKTGLTLSGKIVNITERHLPTKIIFLGL